PASPAQLQRSHSQCRADEGSRPRPALRYRRQQSQFSQLGLIIAEVNRVRDAHVRETTRPNHLGRDHLPFAGTFLARYSTAACTPPWPWGMPSAVSPISTTLSVPRIIGALMWPIWAMRKPRPALS